MSGNDDYYGYVSGENDKLADLRRLGRHTGENLTKYGDETVGSEYFQDYEETYKPPGKPDERNTQATYDYYQKKDVYGRTGGSGSGIEAIYQRMMAQDPAKVQNLIDHWQQIATGLTAVIAEIKRKSDGVAKAWVSPGAKQFLALGPGAAMKSVADWQLAASQTA